MKLYRWYFIIVVLALTYTIGFITSFKQLFPYNQIRYVYNIFFKENVKKGSTIFENCEIPTINEIPFNSVVFIGHAYGSPSNSKEKEFIADSVKNFIEKNSKKINRIIFTGDVFSIPSISKWNKLFNLTNGFQEIDIAPGNHDILRADSKDVFLQSKFGGKNYPYKININDIPLIVDDSISSNWGISKDVINLIENDNQKTNFLIARHNIPIIDLKEFANSEAGINSDFDNFYEFEKKLPKKNITWIIGDGGAFKSLPRIICLKKNNHKFIINGIGEIENDKVVILSKNELYAYVLKNTSN